MVSDKDGITFLTSQVHRQFSINTFAPTFGHPYNVIGIAMELKPMPSVSSEKMPNESLNASKEPRNLATSASVEIRKDVERATGQLSTASLDQKSPIIREAAEVEGEVADGEEIASRIADKVQQLGQKAIEATSASASSAVDVAEQKVRQAQSRIDIAKRTTNDFIHEDPVRAVTYTVIGSAVLTAALIGLFRLR